MTDKWNSDLIIPGSSYGDPRVQSRQASAPRPSRPDTIHGMTPNEAAALNERMSTMMPRLASSNPTLNRRDVFTKDLPAGATWDPRRTGQMSGGGRGWGNGGGASNFGPSAGGGGDFSSQQRPYLPEFESPDRQNYPVHRILANRYWKLFIKMDPVIGTCLDLYSEMPWSDCKLTGEGVDGEVRETYETMWETCSVLSLLQSMTKEYLGIGEVVPHCFFDDKEGMWTYVALHNPDNLEVIDAPFIRMDPIVEFVPDDQLRGVLTSSDPELQKIREGLPPELLSKLYSRQNIRINTETNATFIARKLHPYETRGTSILSRMWRILMYEDAIFNASIATARRHAGPLKIAKLGNPQTNWIPGPEQERRLLEIMAQAEMDPHAWIVWNYGVQFEAFGTTDRVMTINREWDVIERIKLAAMGVNRGFMSGESTYACFVGNTPVQTINGTKLIKNIQLGDQVYDKDGKLASVENVWCEGVPEEVVKLRVYGIDELSVTTTHRFPVLKIPDVCHCGCGKSVVLGRNYTPACSNRLSNKDRQANYHVGPFHLKTQPKLEKIPASEIRPNDFLAIPRYFEVIKTDVTDDQARLLGYYLAEGDTEPNSRNEAMSTNFFFAYHEKETWIKDVDTIIVSLGGETIIRPDPGSSDDNPVGGCSISIIPEPCITIDNKPHFDRWGNFVSTKNHKARPSHPISQWLMDHGGNKAWGKVLSPQVMGWPVRLKQEILKGYFRGDGSRYGGNVVHGSTVSRNLAYQLQQICAQCGILLKVERIPKEVLAEKTKNDAIKRGNWDDYILTSDGDMGLELREIVWGVKESLDHYKSKFKQWRDENYVYTRVESVEVHTNSEPVYNLTTSSGSYLANCLATYNSATAGLQVFLRRVGALRNFFESIWIRPKFFKPVAEINKFYKPTSAEVSHHIKVTRTAQELKEQHRLIIPKLEWSAKLNPNVDNDLIAAYDKLESMGLRISKTKKMAVVNLSFEDELRKSIEEDKLENKVREEYGVSKDKVDPKKIQEVIDKTDQTLQDKEPGQGGGQLQPPPNPRGLPTGSASSLPGQGAPQPVIPEESEKVSAEGETPKPNPKQNLGQWSPDEIDDLIELLETGDTPSAQWSKLKPRRELVTKTGPDGVERQIPRLVGYDPSYELQSGDPEEAWNQIDDFLQEEGYPENDINSLRSILIQRQILPKLVLERFEELLPEDSSILDDEQFGNLFASTLGSKAPFQERDLGTLGPAKLLTKTDTFLVGRGGEADIKRRQGQAITFLDALTDSSNSYDTKVTGTRVIASNEEFASVVHGVNCTCHRVSIKTPKFEPAQNHESRNEWGNRLEKSKIPEEAKRYIKQLENEIVDGHNQAFEKLWESIEKRLELRIPLDKESLGLLIEENLRNQIKHVDHEALGNAWTGLFSEGKSHAYKPTGFTKKKLDRLQSKTSSKVAFTKTSVTIDSFEDNLTLQHIKENALSKVKNLSPELKEKILQKLTEPGSESLDPITLANQLIKEQAKAKKDEMEGASKEKKEQLREQIKQLYESQQYQLQRIMRTESVNAFVKSQLLGYLEQGIQKVTWKSLNDTKTCNLCKTLTGQQFDIKWLLSNDENYVLTANSHPNCRCGLEPVIAYATLDEFMKEYEELHPDKFAPGDTIFDESKLQPSDILQDSVESGGTVFNKVPVEHVDSVSDLGKALAESDYAQHAPKKVQFVQDVYNEDAYQLKGKPAQSQKGQLISWHDPSTNTTLVSSYASEFSPIEDTLSRDWSQRVWAKEPKVQKEWTELYQTAPQRTSANPLSKKTLETLRTTFKPFPLGQTYYLENGAEALGLTKKTRTVSEVELQSILDDLKIPQKDIDTIIDWRKQTPIWDLKSGEVSEAEGSSDRGFINHEASLNPEAFFVETIRAFISEPYELKSKDPKLFNIVKDQIFKGKDFLK
jgi:SPP1 gp7 family putative phage head morphogenesis protein